MDQYLDFWNLMGYDYAGSWDHVAGHQANLYPSTSNPKATPFSTSHAIQHYKSHGIASHKLVLGMPLYGRAFAATNGPGTASTRADGGSWEPGVWDFKALPQSGSEEHFDEEAVASWSYDPQSKLLISYDNAKVTERKEKYIRDEKLGGAMWWESSGDKKGDGSLIAKVSYNLSPLLFVDEPG